MERTIFREYDIRGVYEQQFDLDFSRNLGRALVTFIRRRNGNQPIVLTVGYDARNSSPDIAKAVCQGMAESGAEVKALGLITSPMSYFSTFTLPSCVGGIMVTGSHNPPEYNGFKISYGKTTIHGDEIQELYDIMMAKNYFSAEGNISAYDIFPEYVQSFKKDFVDLSGVKVQFDCGNGAGGIVLRKLTEALNIDCDILFEEPDGTFPNHHPDPTVEKNLASLKVAVRESKSKVGIGFDGDADRIGCIDENGSFLLGDDLMIIYSRELLPKSPGSIIVGDVKCSNRMYAEIQRLGGEPIMWKTGHSLVKNKIKETGAPFGGELSGHIFFADRNFGYDDAIYAAFRLIEILKKNESKTVSQMLTGLPTAFSTPELRLDTTEEKKNEIVKYFLNEFEKTTGNNIVVSTIDGLRISYPDSWILVRASNTQPVIVFRFEAETKTRLDELMSEFNQHLSKFELRLS